MVIERFKNGDPRPVYERFDQQGRLMPEDITYIGSWITEDCTTCYQIMEAPSIDHLKPWADNWSDLVDFEILPVLKSKEARTKILGS